VKRRVNEISQSPLSGESPDIFLLPKNHYYSKIMYICTPNLTNKKFFAMAGTYSQMHIQLVFAVKNHQSSFIKKEWKDEIEKYITGIIANNNCKLLAIYCNPDHVHILIGSRPSVLLSDLVRKIKSSSSKFIHEKFDKNKHFVWQEGYGVFTYSRSQIDLVIRYILNQEKHHHRKTFREEYIDMLKKSRIDFDEKYLFD